MLQLFHLVVEKRNHIFEKEVEKLVNPFAQAKLAILGYPFLLFFILTNHFHRLLLYFVIVVSFIKSKYTPVLEYPAVSSMISGPNTDGWWAQYMAEAKISPVQMQKLLTMREEIWKIGLSFITIIILFDLNNRNFIFNCYFGINFVGRSGVEAGKSIIGCFHQRVLSSQNACYS